jgi:hypothetical protein
MPGRRSASGFPTIARTGKETSLLVPVDNGAIETMRPENEC